METIEKCDNESKNLLCLVQDVTNELQEKINNLQQQKELNHLTSIPPAPVDDSARSMENTYTENETKLFENVTPDLKEDEFSHHLLASKTSGSTSTPNAASKNYKTRNYKKDIQMESPALLRKNSDSEELWSVETKPLAFALSQESNAGDFHHVEAVLPKTQHSLSVQRRKIDCEDDDFSDGSQSHTVYTIAKLVSELNNQKKKNKMLEDRIKCLENEVSAAKIQFDLEQFKQTESETGQLSSLVEEVYHAQKERESAMLARLKLAIQERDEAVLRAKAIAKDASLGPHSRSNIYGDNDSTLGELMHTVCEAESGRATEKHGLTVLERISKLKEERDRITSEEMAAVIAERDDALHKNRLLNEEVKSFKEKIAQLQSASDRKKNANDQIDVLSLQKDRDAALQRLCSVQEEMETLRIYYSLHKSLVQSGRLATQQAEQDDAERLVKSLRVAQDHNKVQESNAHRHEAEIRRLTDKNERLERLVNVLRKKLTVMTRKSSKSLTNTNSAAAHSPR